MIFRSMTRRSSSSLLVDIILSEKLYFISILLDADRTYLFAHLVVIKGSIILRGDAIIIIFLILIFAYGIYFDYILFIIGSFDGCRCLLLQFILKIPNFNF